VSSSEKNFSVIDIIKEELEALLSEEEAFAGAVGQKPKTTPGRQVRWKTGTRPPGSTGLKFTEVPTAGWAYEEGGDFGFSPETKWGEWQKGPMPTSFEQGTGLQYAPGEHKRFAPGTDPWTMATQGRRVPTEKGAQIGMQPRYWEKHSGGQEFSKPVYTPAEMETAQGVKPPQKEKFASPKFAKAKGSVELGGVRQPQATRTQKTRPERPLPALGRQSLPAQREPSPTIDPTKLNLARRATRGSTWDDVDASTTRTDRKIKRWAGPEAEPAKPQTRKQVDTMLSQIRGPGRVVEILKQELDELLQEGRGDFFKILKNLIKPKPKPKWLFPQVQRALVPISAKPFHKGHMALINKASEENDMVHLFVSLSDRVRPGELPISGKAMQEIWRDLEYILPRNVMVEYGGSPVRKVYETVGAANTSGNEDVFRIYSDPTDTLQNYPIAKREQYFGDAKVEFPAEVRPEEFTRGEGMPDVSGTSVRNSIATGDFETFADAMPEGVDVDKIWDILTTFDR